MVEQEKKKCTTSLSTTQKDPVSVKVGEKFEVKLEENPSTGYVWLLLDQELEFHGLKGVIKVSNTKFEPPHIEKKRQS